MPLIQNPSLKKKRPSKFKSAHKIEFGLPYVTVDKDGSDKYVAFRFYGVRKGIIQSNNKDKSDVETKQIFHLIAN